MVGKEPSLAKRSDPWLANRFKLEIDGVVEAGFSECGGLTVETEFEERREGGQNGFVHRFPKGTKFGNLVLKRGITESASLWKWHQEVVAGKITPRNLSVVLQDSTGAEKWRWNITKAYPAKWVGPELKADGSTVAVETLELVHHGLAKK